MIGRATYDLLRAALRFALRLWPLWLFWFAWSVAGALWRDVLLAFPDRSTTGYTLAYRGWPSAALLGPILLMAAAIGAYRLQFANRLMPLAGIAGVAVATVITAWSEYWRVASYLGRAPLLNVLDAFDPGILQAVAAGLFATIGGIGLTMRQSVGMRFSPRLLRGRSDNFGHAAWLSKRDASRLFPGPDETYGG